jgi:transcription initiation factor TFIID TATA-box-binding protein
MRIIDPKSVLIIFHSGKIILTGTKIFDDIDFIINILIQQFNREEIVKNKLSKEDIEIEIVNIVITADLHNKIDLDLASLVLENTIYDPEVFPGLIYKDYEPVRCTFLIFSTGKVVFTGIARIDVINPCLINLERLIRDKNLFKS